MTDGGSRVLNHLVEVSLRYRLLVLIVYAVVAALGVRAYQNVPIDAFPDVTPVQVLINTDAPGMAAEDVEQLITAQVEAALAGLPKIQEVRSASTFGWSAVTLFFDDDMDVYFARQLVNERLQEVGDRLPEGLRPELGPNSSGLGQVFWYSLERAKGVSEAQVSDMDLRDAQDWIVRPILQTVAGVDEVTTWGGDERQFQVQIDPSRLASYGIGFADVVAAVRANNAQVGGQYLELGSERFIVRGLGLIESEDDLRAITLKSVDGAAVYLRDVAKVSQAPAPRMGAATRDGTGVVLGITLARIGENAKDVVDAVKAKLGTVQAALPKGIVLTPIYERTDLVEAAVGTANRALLEGSILVAVLLFLFLGELRSAIVVIVALPMAMLIAFIGMQYLGLSANLMSLAGLAIGIGMMVDGAVVIVENTFRIMAERRSHGEASGTPVNRVGAVLSAAQEVGKPIVFAISIIIVVFLPLFSLQGLEGKLFKPMAVTISLAMAGSLVLSLTLIPVLASLVLKPGKEHDTRLVAWLKRHYRPLLDGALAHKSGVMIGAVLALLASLSLFPFLGKEFMPQLQEGAIMWRVTTIPSTSLAESIKVSNRLAEIFKQFPEVITTLTMIGPAEKGETSDVNYMEVYTALKPPAEWSTGRSLPQLQSAMQAALDSGLPTAVASFTQPIQMRVEELISGVRATLVLKLYGQDLATLDDLSQRLSQVLAKVDGVADLALEANLGKPQIRVRVDRAALARYGMNAEDVLDLIRMGLGGDPVSVLLQGSRRFDIAVRLDDSVRGSVAELQRLPLRSSAGVLVPLSAVAKIDVTEGYSFVRREQLQRYAVVQMDVHGRDVDGFVREANAAIARQIELPAGYWLEWGGAFENQQRALARLALIVPLTIFFIFILLYTAFNSFRHAALILANVPFATVGGLFALFVTRQYLSVPSAIGFIAVFGVAMLNGIVLVSFLNELRERGLSVREAVLQGTALRLRPVLMTASVAILGLVPMLLSSGVGAETQRPLATVVVGGLVSSTLLTLILLPVLYEWMEGRAERRAPPTTRNDPLSA
jgi:heavy metal efflux system protein